MKAFGSSKTPWNSKQVSRWEKIRAKGKFHFILIYGALIWGGVMILALNSIHLLDRGPSEKSYLITSLIVFPIAGLLMGFLMWNRNEASYQYFKSQKELDSLTLSP